MAASKIVQGIIIFLAVIAVAVADVMLKKAATQGSLGKTFSSPWMIMAIGLYLFQILLFTIAFASGWKLSLIGALQTSLYALIVLASGVFIYKENLNTIQIVGVLMALGGVLLINRGIN